jgi:hypothetical protein
MSLISAGSISLDSTFNGCFVIVSTKDTVRVFSMNMYAEALANPIKYQQNILEERARVRH